MAVYEGTSTQMKVIETDLYGSSRLGLTGTQTVATAEQTINGFGIVRTFTFTRGEKSYELNNHLGNVLSTISDRRQQIPNNSTVSYYVAEVTSATDYYPFGMQMSSRTVSSSSYRYGFNGQEKSSELTEGQYTAQFWEYDSRSGRRWNIDPIVKAGQSPYATFNGNPLYYIDPTGLTGEPNKETGQIKANFIFVRAKGLTDKQYEDYKANYTSSIQNYYNGSLTYNNGKSNVSVTGNFTFSENSNLSAADVTKMADAGKIENGTNYIVVGGTNGRSYVNDKRNVAYMNVNMGGNTYTHETQHLFGLADRYNYVQLLKGNVSTTFKSVNMLLGKNEDPEYYDHESQNIMTGDGNVTTQKQWDYIFSGVTEKTRQVTYLTPLRGYNQMGAFGVSADYKSVITRPTTDNEIRFNIGSTNNGIINPFNRFISSGVSYLFDRSVLGSTAQQNFQNVKIPYEGGQ